MSLIEKINELTAAGFTPAEARELASLELRKEMQSAGNAASAEELSGTARTSQGLPATYQRTSKGVKVPVVEEKMCCLVPGGAGKGSVSYGPGMEFRFVEYTTKDSSGPNPLWVPGASSSSYHRNVDETAVVQFARSIVADESVRLFIQDHKPRIEKDEKTGRESTVLPDAVEFTDRAVWLESVRDRVGDFLEDCSEAAQTVGIKTRKRY